MSARVCIHPFTTFFLGGLAAAHATNTTAKTSTRS